MLKAIGTFILYIVLQFIFGFFTGIIRFRIFGYLDLIIPAIDAIQDIFIIFFTFLSALIIYFGVYKSPIKQEILKFKKFNLGLFLLIFLGSYFLRLGYLELIMNVLPYENSSDWSNLDALGSIANNSKIIFFIFITIMAPIGEELVFRGTLLHQTLEKRSLWVSILFQSFLFGLIHFNPWQGIYAFWLGIILGYIVWKTKNLWPAIVLHSILNASALIIPEVSIYLRESLNINAITLAIPAIIIGLILTVTSLRKIEENNERQYIDS